MSKQTFFLFSVFIIFFAACSKKETETSSVQPKTTPENISAVEEKPDITFLTYPQDDGWGYDIFINGKMYIHQPYIPAVSGLQTFKTDADAKKAAEFVKTKIEKNILPPSVSPQELDSLGVLHE
jgi:hypothetical protein